MCYNEALVMPCNYVAMDNDEMEYVDGGAWNSVENIGRALDIAIFVGGLAMGIIGIHGSVKTILANNAKGLIVQSTKKLLKQVGISAAGFIANSIVGGLLLFLDLSLGEAIAKLADRFDAVPRNGVIAF